MAPSGLEYQVKKTIEENPEIGNYLKAEPKLHSVLYRMHDDLYAKSEQIKKRIYDEHHGIIKGAELVDKVDRIFGPIEAGLRWLGPGIGYMASFGLRAIEELVFKIPYSIYYGAKTKLKDIKGLMGMALAEAAATILPYGDVLDALPTYKWIANRYVSNEFEKYMRNSLAKSFLDYVKSGVDYKNMVDEPQDVVRQEPAKGKVLQLNRDRKKTKNTPGNQTLEESLRPAA